ncbi:uncharacterized protein BDV14DRAFT_172718 [Aspergillus stella-maris]|uniref:uncharacterized protein n=1 Tax=Aspergillus stella-maris TaxID=1810926 RepID=UPI003CCD3F87
MADSISPISKPSMYTAIWVQYGICTAVMVLRGYSQFFVLRKFATDDFVMLGAYIIQGVASALVTTATHWGLGSPILDLDYIKVTQVLKYTMISQPFGVIAPLLGRISFMLFLLNSVITVHTASGLRRKLLWCLIALQVPVNIVPCILQFTQCDPVDALWDPSRLMTHCQGALVVKRFGYFQGGFNALTDLILIIIGVAVIISLKMRRSNKMVLGGILSLSLLYLLYRASSKRDGKTDKSSAMIAAILKTVQLGKISSMEFSKAMGLWAIWFLTEGTVVITTASVPRLRAIMVIGRQRSKSSYNYNYNYGNYNNYNGATLNSSRLDPHRTRPTTSDKNQILMTTDLHIEREDMPPEFVRQNSQGNGGIRRGRSVLSAHGDGTTNPNGAGSLTTVQAAGMESGVELLPMAKERSAI